MKITDKTTPSAAAFFFQQRNELHKAGEACCSKYGIYRRCHGLIGNLVYAKAVTPL